MLLVLLVVNLLFVLWLLLRKSPDNTKIEMQALVLAGNDKIEREVRREIVDNGRANRQELSITFATFQQTLTQQSAEAIRTQNTQIDAFGQQLALLQKTLSDTLVMQLQSISESNARRMGEVRETLEKQLAQLQATNSAKLDEMRKTVDEKLQATLETRLGESFKQVADRLEQVHKGLGEMQTLAQGVGDLKHLLTNVKTRGIFGEAQLSALLEQVFTVDQYAAQVAIQPGSKSTVDFAIKLPGRSDSGEPLWLPIDAKFPNEDYERLLDAQQRADGQGAEAAGNLDRLRPGAEQYEYQRHVPVPVLAALAHAAGAGGNLFRAEGRALRSGLAWCEVADCAQHRFTKLPQAWQA